MKITLTLCILIAVQTLLAQFTESQVREIIKNSSEKELVFHSSRFLQENFFHFADLATSRLLEISPENPNYNFRKGLILVSTKGKEEDIIKHFSKCTKKIQKNYDAYSKSEDAVPVDVFYYLGVALHRMEQLDSAIENYKKFISLSSSKSQLIVEAAIRISQCEVAKKNISSPTNFQPKNLGNILNSEFSESKAEISADGKKLFITSGRPWPDNSDDKSKDPFLYTFKKDVYSSFKDVNNQWTAPLKFSFSTPDLNECFSNVSIDERIITLNNDLAGVGDVFHTLFENNLFSNPKPSHITEVNTIERWESDFTESMDGKLRFFVSDRATGKGKRDIYFSELTGANWSIPQNIASINSESDEISPFIGLDNKTLYFSSNGNESMGGFDIFVSHRDQSGEWSSPINLGYPLNSVADDYSFTQSANGQDNVFVSSRNGGNGKEDLYEISKSPVLIEKTAFLNGRIVSKNKKVIPENTYVLVKCLNCEDKSEKKLLARVSDGFFGMKLEKCREYELSYYYDNLSKNPFSEKFNTNCEQPFEEVNKKVLLDDDNRVIVPILAYEVTLTILDKMRSFPIKNAAVLINENNKNRSLTTDNNGQIQMKLSEDFIFGDELNLNIKVSKVGYESADKSISKKLEYNQSVFESISLLNLKQVDSISIYFASNEHIISEESKKILIRVVNKLKKNPKLQIQINSYADVTGSDEYNTYISKKRAVETSTILESLGVKPEQIYSLEGFGEVKISTESGKIGPDLSIFRRSDIIFFE